MGWVAVVFNFFTSKAMVKTGAGATILVAGAAYTDYKLKQHIDEQEKINVRAETGLITVNNNLFLLELAIITGKEQHLKKIEPEKK